MAADLTWTRAATPLGTLTVVASDRGIVATDLGETWERLLAELGEGSSPPRRDDAGLAEAREDAASYFAGTRKRLRTPVDLSFATGFTRAVYEATMAVPYGELRTYGDVATAAGSPRAYRAAGTALRHCPIELWIPCHRVVRSDGGLSGYRWGVERKRALLKREAG